MKEEMPVPWKSHRYLKEQEGRVGTAGMRKSKIELPDFREAENGKALSGRLDTLDCV